MNAMQLVDIREKDLKKELQGISKKKALAVKLDKRLKELRKTISEAQKEFDKIHNDKRVKELIEIIQHTNDERNRIYNQLNVGQRVILKAPRSLR